STQRAILPIASGPVNAQSPRPLVNSFTMLRKKSDISIRLRDPSGRDRCLIDRNLFIHNILPSRVRFLKRRVVIGWFSPNSPWQGVSAAVDGIRDAIAGYERHGAQNACRGGFAAGAALGLGPREGTIIAQTLIADDCETARMNGQSPLGDRGVGKSVRYIHTAVFLLGGSGDR